jgi:hypothetical protein
MRKERTEGIESKCREYPIEKNLEIWLGMIEGKFEEYCVRAKINM